MDLGAAKNSIEFRLVLSQDEIEGKKYTTVKDGSETLYVWQLHYLTESDLEKVEVYRSTANARSLMVGFKFTVDGRKRLYNFTKKYAKRRVAIFADDKLVTAPIIWIPYFMGDKVVVRWPGSQKDLLEFASRVNKRETVVSLFIEEQGKYNDIASDEWAKYYERVNSFIEARRHHGHTSYSISQSMSPEE